MKVFKALGLAMALVGALLVVSAAPASAGTGSFNCTGTSGSVVFSNGPVLNNSRAGTIKASGAGVACTGGFVTAGTVAFNVQTQTVNCTTIIGSPSLGNLTGTWTAPAGMGSSRANIKLTITSTSGGTTSGKISGRVTTVGTPIGSGKAISGTFTIDKGLKSVASGGHCTLNTPISSANITALAIRTI